MEIKLLINPNGRNVEKNVIIKISNGAHVEEALGARLADEDTVILRNPDIFGSVTKTSLGGCAGSSATGSCTTSES